MTGQQPSGGGSFSDEIYSEVAPTHSSPVVLKVDFKAWHKPRKQWVRKFQWLSEIDNLVKQLCLDDGRPLKYLSLPGKDMLDVRYITSWCQGKGLNLKFLGYNDPFASADPSDSELNLSVAELTQRASVDLDSEVVSDKFEAVSDCDSVAYRKLVEVGPFDVINLDLCGSVVGHVPLAKQLDYYNAIYELVAFQKKARTEPWLLFLTTRSDMKLVAPEASWKLYSCIAKNAEQHESFKDKLLSGLGFDYKPVTRPSDKSVPYVGMSYRNLVSLGFGKWLLGLHISGQPKWEITMLNSAEYRITHPKKSPEMQSLAFRCSQIVEPPRDAAGFSNAHASASSMVVTEETLALGLIDGVKNIKDVDAIMSDKTLKSTLTNEAAQLMEDAHYDGEKYKSWAKRY